MPVWWRRLVACVTLVVFLATKPVPFSHCQLPFFSGSPCSKAETRNDSNGKEVTGDPGCKHCRANRIAQPGATPAPALAPPVGIYSERVDSPASSCPCQNNQPHCPICPCPDSCVICSVAKIPCYPPHNPTLPECSLAGHCVPEVLPVWSPLFSGKLFRPPRL
jgi:hypothetical protein